MKTAIVYVSAHHGNTKKLVDAIAAADDEVTVIDAARQKDADLTGYDRIGFASGIYYSKFHKAVLAFAGDCLPEGKDVFLLYTYGSKSDKYTKAISRIVSAKPARIIGEYGCPGLDTFGPLKLFGGTAKGHPTEDEVAQAVAFYKAL